MNRSARASLSSAAALDRIFLGKVALLFLGVSLAYFLLRSPGLDDYDSVLFALGVRQFNLWIDQPHPPGYPLFIFFGWLGDSLAHLGPELSLHLVAAIGGGLFVAAWVVIARLQFNEPLAWLIGLALFLTPAIWMTATKVLTDSLAAGFLSVELLLALLHRRTGRRGLLFCAAIAGAAAVGTRPQLILEVVLVLALTLRARRESARIWAAALGVFVFVSLFWLLPTCYLQARWHPELPAWSAYGRLLWKQWQYRLVKPQVSMLAGGWSWNYLGARFGSHLLGWFGLGFGLLEHWSVLLLGGIFLLAGFIAYFRSGIARADADFWRWHAPWLLLHIAIVLVCLPPAQRYYLVVFPFLLVALLRGLRSLPAPWAASAYALPAFFLALLIPLARTNHLEQSPPVRLVEYLQKLYPPAERGRVVLLLTTAQRHAEWYAPDFRRVHPTSAEPVTPAMTAGALAVYTDNDELPFPKGWRRIPVATFARSYIIHMKYHEVHLYRVEKEGSW